MQSTVEQRVMAGVATVYAVRQLISVAALKCYALILSVAALWQFTWVHKIFANWAHVGLGGSWSYLSYAFMHTHLPVQLALLVAAAAGISLAVDILRTFARSSPHFAY